MAGQREQRLGGAAWVRVGADANTKWPEWKRRWLVLADGTVLVPLDVDRGQRSEARAAIKSGATWAACCGRVLVDAAWLADHRTPADAAALRAAVDTVLAVRRAG